MAKSGSWRGHLAQAHGVVGLARAGVIHGHGARAACRIVEADRQCERLFGGCRWQRDAVGVGHHFAGQPRGGAVAASGIDPDRREEGAARGFGVMNPGVDPTFGREQISFVRLAALFTDGLPPISQ